MPRGPMRGKQRESPRGLKRESGGFPICDPKGAAEVVCRFLASAYPLEYEEGELRGPSPALLCGWGEWKEGRRQAREEGRAPVDDAPEETAPAMEHTLRAIVDELTTGEGEESGEATADAPERDQPRKLFSRTKLYRLARGEERSITWRQLARLEEHLPPAVWRELYPCLICRAGRRAIAAYQATIRREFRRLSAGRRPKHSVQLSGRVLKACEQFKEEVEKDLGAPALRARLGIEEAFDRLVSFRPLRLHLRYKPDTERIVRALLAIEKDIIRLELEQLRAACDPEAGAAESTVPAECWREAAPVPAGAEEADAAPAAASVAAEAAAPDPREVARRELARRSGPNRERVPIWERSAGNLSIS